MTYTGNVSVGGPADTRELPGLSITKVSVGPMDNNAYLLRSTSTGELLLIDAANDADTLLGLVGGTPLATIVTTHQHWDHWAALQAVQKATGARTVAHPEDRHRPGPARRHDHGRRRGAVRHPPARPHSRQHCALLRRGRRAVRPAAPVYRRFAVPGRARQHRARPGTVRPAHGRPRGTGVRRPARRDLGVPRSRRGHHARSRAPAPARMARPRLVASPAAAGPATTPAWLRPAWSRSGRAARRGGRSRSQRSGASGARATAGQPAASRPVRREPWRWPGRDPRVRPG